MMPSLARRKLEQAAYDAMSIVARYPGLALPAARRRGHGVVLGPGTDILIEGYPRSANSFAVAAFRMAQPHPVEVAHHTHAPAHVIAAVRRGIPAIVLIREPEDAVLEFVIVKRSLTVRQALRGYVRFYRPLLAHRGGFVVGSFPEVTSDFGAVIRRVNDRFGTAFALFEHTDDNVRACFEAMDGYWRDRLGSGERLERVVGRPSEVRERIKAGMRASYHAPGLEGLRWEAERLYHSFGTRGGG
jgi:hypothetical protein